MKSHLLSVLSGLAAASLLAACASAPAAAPTQPPPTALPAVGVTLSAPTQPAPTDTSAPPTKELPTDTAAPSPTPKGVVGPTDFPPNVDPLTGETVADPALLDRIPVAVKIANTPDVRPQWGLGEADAVYEYFTEGGITRFTAVFLAQDAKQIGSVRSARLIDLEIPNMYHALLAYSGASVGVNEKMRATSFFDRILTPDFGRAAAFWRDDSIPVPHNLFTSTEALRADAASRGVDIGRQDLHGLAFNPAPPEGGVPGRQVTLSYNVSYVVWSYQEALGQYLRWDDGVEHTDRLTGQQISASNVVVLYANHVCDWSVVEDANNPNAYWYSIEIQVWGTGDAKIFRDGQAYDVKWLRNAPGDMLGFVDSSNAPFTLKPGKTWYQVVALNSSTTSDGDKWLVDPKEPGCVKKPG